MAHFPFQRTIDERQAKELASLAFVPEATDILMLGPPGVGMTHLAVALAKRATSVATAPTSSGPTGLCGT